MLAQAHGAGGGSALDVACGTGNSIAPLLELGYEVTGVDAVASMLDQARAKFGDRVPLHRADMAELPVLGAFDLVTCLNDPVNHLSTAARLTRALAAMAANLRPGGILVFDTNTPVTYRSFFAPGTRTVPAGDGTLTWAGGGFAAGSATATIVLPGGATAPQLQHHHEPAAVARAVRAAGLVLRAVKGQHDDGRRDPDLDPAVHTKAVWVCRRPGPTIQEEVRDEGQEEPEGGGPAARLHEGHLSGGPARVGG
ncbi:MAG TPA: class I SAM-dependent methyltransferase [Solirubrobacteraceae bacterium]|nr:class I SAM-dependent methyltransferase [Solirubrobacteraceae bacterium]